MLIGNNDGLATHKKNIKNKKHTGVWKIKKIRKNKEQSFRVRNKNKKHSKIV